MSGGGKIERNAVQENLRGLKQTCTVASANVSDSGLRFI